MKLSIAMIVKNEEALLERCLKSVVDADEIVIVDTGSEDNTIEIAKKYTDKVFTDYKWEAHFANARNHAISKCTGDWIFTIDADDWLEEGGIAQLRKMMAKHPDEMCMDVKYVNTSGDRTHSSPTFYKNCKEVFWRGAAHNHLSIRPTIAAGVTTRFGWSPAHKNDPDRTFNILKAEVLKNPDKPRELYYLAREYRYRSRWQECLEHCDRYLKVAVWAPEMADMQLMKAISLWNLQRGEEARDACLQAIKINTNFKEAILLMSNMTGPINRDRWLFMAELADNTKLLFVREKAEKPASYYEAIYNKVGDNEIRYNHIYEEVSRVVGSRRAFDIGCGQGKLSSYIKNYDGVDMAQNPFQVGDIYTHDLGDYSVYVLLEVLEHLIRDIDVIKRIPKGANVVFSVPSFDDPAHVRMFTEDIVRWRYRDLIKLTDVTRFDMDSKTRQWTIGAPATPSYILLCNGQRV